VAAEREASLREGRVQAARVLRSARARAYDETLDAVRVRLAALRDDPSYPRVLAALVAECRSTLAEGHILRVDPRDEPLVRGVDHDLTVEHSLSTWGGCELDDGQGRVARNTLEQRLAVAEPELRRLLGASTEQPDAAS
jgi:vacuolar-type H+-ATPase subunit E/Vma4